MINKLQIMPVLIWSLLLVSCSGCTAQQTGKSSIHQQQKSNTTMKIKSMATGYVKSGNYGGSVQKEQFPSVYKYSFFDGNNSSKNAEFQVIINEYLQSIKVNNTVSLQEYLEHLYNQNTAKLTEIHNQPLDKKPVGNSLQELPTLFFVDDQAATVLRIDPNQVQLSWNAHTTKLNTFLQENATHFSSETPDEFYMKYYGK
ncbi:hypothetical protein [Paenimyroides aestuarii]|uniref:Lipoprotein n=1 Tax=Paenimyroides aestuarii TaxID=2968490 RepID=A0ABY5NRQ3_9FLAO|nr:hypothetical protein [Paenimyroides aestuarii]UUV21248.1 hypothetical protein NPX36_13110 [Paenimyroides aestuarii]